MSSWQSPAEIGLLLSGGLDSSILLWRLLADGSHVQPFYVRSHLSWEPMEQQWLSRLLDESARDNLQPLVVLDLPLADVYGQHWSTTGQAVPDAETPDEAVYLPGRNALLLIKAALWCQLHGIEELALAPLKSNPFPDATEDFFGAYETALNLATDGHLRIVRPFGQLSKTQVMELGSKYPLGLTFSCIAPVGELHCGRCNKCAERRKAFTSAGLTDPTGYAV